MIFFFLTKQLSLCLKVSAAVGTSQYISSAGISFNVCCHSNGRQLQTEQDVKFFFPGLSFQTGAVPLGNCIYLVDKKQ